MLKTGIVGSKESIQKYLPVFEKLKCYEFVGYFDAGEPENFNSFYGSSLYDSFLKKVHAVVFANDYNERTEDTIIQTIKASKHVLTDGFLLRDEHKLSQVAKLNTEAGVCVQLAGMASTEPTYTTMLQYLNRVESFKLRRFVNYNKHSQHSDLFDYIAKDIEMALKAVNSNVQKVRVNPVSVFHETWDKIAISLDFDNGASADLSFSKISDTDRAEIECYQPKKYYKADLVNPNCTEVKKQTEPLPQLQLDNELSLPLNQVRLAFIEKQVMMFDAFEKDFVNFYDSCLNHVSPLVGIDESLKVMKVIKKVQHALDKLYVA